VRACVRVCVICNRCGVVRRRESILMRRK
jgi:hypothetical protein